MLLLISAAIRFVHGDKGATALSHFIRNSKGELVAWRAIMVTEVAVGLLVLFARPELGGSAAALFMAGAAAYLAGALRFTPERRCGCLGGREPVSKRTLLRAVFLCLVASLYAVEVNGPMRYVDDPLAWIGLAIFGAVVVVAAPETSDARSWLVDHHAWGACWQSPVDPDASRVLAMRTHAWKLLEPYLESSAPDRDWREGCWHYLGFPACWEGRRATATFALRLPPGRSSCSAMLRVGLVGPTVLRPPAERVRWPAPTRAHAMLPAWLGERSAARPAA